MMDASNELSLANVSLFIFVVATQIVAVSLIPRTNGFTNLYCTIACLIVYGVSLWAISIMIRTGMQLGLLMPLLAAVVPLAIVGIGIVVYREPASVRRIALLCVACAAIGLASSGK